MRQMERLEIDIDYQKGQELILAEKYVFAVVHLENIIKKKYDKSSVDTLKCIYQDIILSYKAINNSIRSEYYKKKAVATFGEVDEFVFNSAKYLEEDIEVSEFSKNIESINDFEILKKPYKVKAVDPNEVNFNSIFVEIFTTLETRKYFGYFKLNLNKLKEILQKGVGSLEKPLYNRINWEIKYLLSSIEKNGITNFDALYKAEFDGAFVEEAREDSFQEMEFQENKIFKFAEENEQEEMPLEIEITSGKNNLIYEWDKSEKSILELNGLEGNDPENSVAETETIGETIETSEIIQNLNVDADSTNITSDNIDIKSEEPIKMMNETIIVEIKSDKVRENNLEVSKVKDVVLEVLENLRKADLDIFTELKVQADDRAQKLGQEKEKKGLISGLEGMLEIKFGQVSLDIVPEMKKINELDRLYEVKDKILTTRDFNEIKVIVGDSIR